MIRTLIFMGFLAMSMLIISCGPTICVAPLAPTVRETLKLVKREASRTIILTTEKVKCNEVDLHAANEIIDSLRETIKQIDTLIAASFQLEKKGNKEAILLFAERTNWIIINTLTNLKSLRDLYDISTNSQFETATFFAADSGNIPPEKMDEAKKAIEPAVQRIIRFFADHPNQKFKAVIACTSIPAGQELNVTLREQKTQSVAKLVIDQIRSYEEFIPHPERISYEIKWMAQIEALPYQGKKKQNKPEDKRRGVVSLIWNLLPVS